MRRPALLLTKLSPVAPASVDGLTGRFCDPICDFCAFYEFNGDAVGGYTGDGRCVHPAHPRPMDPDDACPDFLCVSCTFPHRGGDR